MSSEVESVPPTESTPLTAVTEVAAPGAAGAGAITDDPLNVAEAGGAPAAGTAAAAAAAAGGGAAGAATTTWDAQVKAGAATAATKTAEGAKVAAAYSKDAAVKAYAGAAVGAKVTAEFTTHQVANLKEFVMDGPVPFRVLAFGGGCAIMGASIRDMVDEVIFTDIFQTFAAMFNVFFGIVMVLLESSAVFKKTPWRREMYVKAGFLKTTFGRGFFYVFVGMNMCAQNFSIFSFWIGVYVMALGLIAILVGWWTQRKLTRLRDALRDEEMVAKSFAEVDQNENGSLDIDEFAELCINLGVPMNKVQLMAVFDVIDTSDVGVKKNTVTLEEFRTWWSEWDDLTEVI